MVSNGDGLEDLHDFRKEWIGQFGDNQPEYSAAARDQGARLRIGVVAQFFNDFPNSL